MLFAFFGLWTTTLAVGAGAVAVPIIIHLLNRRRYKIVTWAAMRFLLAAQKQNSRRLRIEQLLLLLVRCAMVALLVLAMASVMPWMENLWAAIWPEGGGPALARTARTHHVFVLDGSLSMTTQLEGKSWFEAARDLALRKIESCPPGDGFSIMVMKDSPAWIVGEASADARKVKRELESLTPGHGNASVPTALNMIAAKVTEYGGRYPSQVVYFFTDMQKATWAGGSNAPRDGDGKGDAPKKDAERDITADIQKKARTVFVDVGRNDVPNLAVSDLGLAPSTSYAISGEETRFIAAVRNFGPKLATAKMEVLVGKAKENAGDGPLTLRSVGSDIIAVAPGEPRSIDFGYKFPSPGTYVVQVKLDADPLELDNVRSMVLTVKDTIPVLLVNGKPTPDRFERATEYLKLALNPFPRGAEPKFAPLRPKVVTVAQFQDMPEAELAEYDAIFLTDVAQVGPADARRLENHVRRGGGLVVSLGDKVVDNIEGYNRFLFKSGQGLLPAELVKKVTAPADHHFALQAAADTDFDSPPLREFAGQEEKSSLHAARFRSYVQSKPATDSRARVFMTFRSERAAADGKLPDKDIPNNDPAFLEWNPPLPKAEGPRPNVAAPRMRGKSILFNSTVNLDWTSWPGSPTFGAMMQEVARFAMTGRLREQASPVGTPLEEYLPAIGGELDAILHLPQLGPGQKSPKVKTQLVDDVNIFRFSDTDKSGIYKLAIVNQPLEIPFAINVPASTPDQRGSESDLSRLDKDILQGLFPGWDIQYVFDPLAAAVQTGAPVAADVDPIAERTPVGPEIARMVLWLVLALQLIEVLLAWRFGHYSTVEGAASQPASGVVWPAVVLTLATLLFMLGTFVLWQDSRSGDFLSFLPDGIRSRVEGWMGVPPPPPGEMTHWELERAASFTASALDSWIVGVVGFISVIMVLFVYLAEAPTVRPGYKLALAALRLFLVFTTLWVFLPQLQLRIDRQGWPDLVMLFDTSRSMGEPDVYQDEKIRERAKDLGERIKKQIAEQLPAKIEAVQAELTSKRALLEKNPGLAPAIEELESRLTYLQAMNAQIQTPTWRPTRLQIAQSLLSTGPRDWISHFVDQRRMKVHMYQLDSQGRAMKLADGEHSASDVNDNTDPTALDRAKKGVLSLDAEGKDSRLGTALRQVIDHYRGSNLAAVVMFTDGVTTRDETIAEFAEYAGQKGVPLFFVGIGDDREIRDLKLHDLQCEDSVYVKDRIVFEARLTGQGYKDLTVPVVLKVKEKDGKEKVIGSLNVKVDPSGKSVKLQLTDRPEKVGRRTYIIEVEPPNVDPNEKKPHSSNLRLERTVDVLETKTIKVLLVEGQPRYEFRFLKFLLEREAAEKKENKSVEIKIFLADADRDFASTDKYMISQFPSTPAALAEYDVIVLGDVNPKTFNDSDLRNLAAFVRGGDDKKKAGDKGGGGLLLLGGPMYMPHAYKDTPLADVMPVEPLTKSPPPEPRDRVERLRLELTPVGRHNPIFRFVPKESENQELWQKLAPMYWWATGFKLKPLAEVLAVHPTAKADVPGNRTDGRLPLAVHQFVGSGRALFYGFEETWRWRFREDESRYGHFWIQTLRFLARGRSNRTDLRLDRQTPYRVGEPIKVTVRFPENMPLPGDKQKPEVKVRVEFRQDAKGDAPVDPEISYLQLAKVEGSLATFEDQFKQTREGKYKFRLQTPDVPTPDGEKPAADAVVELPPGELDRLRMNYQDMTLAAEQTQGKFHTLSTADAVPDEVPSGARVLLSTPQPPARLWNHWILFAWVMFLLTGEWLLRKRKHLL
jgi:hypothetical protein